MPRLVDEIVGSLAWILRSLYNTRRPRRRRSPTEDYREALERRAASIPKALSLQRKEISLSYNPAVNASSPLLLKFPLEIRRKIYTYVLGSHVAHILLTPSRFAHICCTCPTLTDFTRTCCPSARHVMVPKPILIPPSDIAVDLLRTCRQIYAEALPVLYSANTFDIDDYSAFVILAGNIPPSGLMAIKSLHLTWCTDYPPFISAKTEPVTNAPFNDPTYLRFWDVVANQMPALRELRLALLNTLWVSTLQGEDPWVQPMKKVRGLDVFEFEVVDPTYCYWEKGQEDAFAAEVRSIVYGRKG